ncbi:hypothetical protein LIPSTDRAFT_102766 [Lipomyces starkeyi NRRL Y-11557]|uniref:Uncharacterized protein n=1 Tax=Lipomyces starkeyi NRRL Y-11557 TaxID=675824 RepID=A0A1E3QAJ3_LIPST|nr:hypothetical protein LIPSTDRAFT_102766 [Lipomyces starkeyi NRRL Y-11557]
MWKADGIARKGDGPGFMVLNPDFEEYFEHLRLGWGRRAWTQIAKIRSSMDRQF